MLGELKGLVAEHFSIHVAFLKLHLGQLIRIYVVLGELGVLKIVVKFSLLGVVLLVKYALRILEFLDLRLISLQA